MTLHGYSNGDLNTRMTFKHKKAALLQVHIRCSVIPIYSQVFSTTLHYTCILNRHF